MTKREKAIQDVEKIGWYAEDAKKRWLRYSDLITQKPVTPAAYTTALLVAEEFAFDKPEPLKNLVRAVIAQAMLLTSKDQDIVKYCDCVNALIEAFAKAEKEGIVENVCYDLPKSFIVCRNKNGEDKVYIAQISACIRNDGQKCNFDSCQKSRVKYPLILTLALFQIVYR